MGNVVQFTMFNIVASSYNRTALNLDLKKLSQEQAMPAHLGMPTQSYVPIGCFSARACQGTGSAADSCFP